MTVLGAYACHRKRLTAGVHLNAAVHVTANVLCMYDSVLVCDSSSDGVASLGC